MLKSRMTDFNENPHAQDEVGLDPDYDDGR